MTELKKFSLIRPTTQTPFHIDFDWWMQHDSNWRIYLKTCLCTEHQIAYNNSNDDIKIDWVDPQTAEIHIVDGLQQTLMTHCARQPGFITSELPLVDSVFRVLLANGNIPLSAVDLSESIGRPAETILRTLTGQVYRGLRPCLT